MNTEQLRAELLPCPFCGGPASIRGDIGLQYLGCADPTGECVGANIALPCYRPERRAESIKRWNRRAAQTHEVAPEQAGVPGAWRLVPPRSLRNYVAALQAENARLRAEVAEWKRVAAAQAELHGEAEARAERLAEALRGWWETRRPVGWTEDQHRSCPHVNLATDAEKALATALLRDQEEGK